MHAGSRMLAVGDLSSRNGEMSRRSRSPRKVVLSYRLVRERNDESHCNGNRRLAEHPCRTRHAGCTLGHHPLPERRLWRGYPFKISARVYPCRSLSYGFLLVVIVPTSEIDFLGRQIGSRDEPKRIGIVFIRASGSPIAKSSARSRVEDKDNDS